MYPFILLHKNSPKQLLSRFEWNNCKNQKCTHKHTISNQTWGWRIFHFLKFAIIWLRSSISNEEICAWLQAIMCFAVLWWSSFAYNYCQENYQQPIHENSPFPDPLWGFLLGYVFAQSEYGSGGGRLVLKLNLDSKSAKKETVIYCRIYIFPVHAWELKKISISINLPPPLLHWSKVSCFI